MGRNREGCPDRSPDDRSCRVHRQPAQSLSPAPALAEDEGDGVQSIGEVVARHSDEDQKSGAQGEVEGQVDAQPVDGRMGRECEGPHRPDPTVSASVIGVVAVMEDQESVGQEEQDKSQGRELRDPSRSPQFALGLGQDVQESDGHSRGSASQGRLIVREQ